MDNVMQRLCGYVMRANDGGGLVAQAQKHAKEVHAMERMLEQERRRVMIPFQRVLYGTLIVLLWGSISLVQAHEPRLEQLGEVHFPVACRADLQQQFDRAVALLHSFSFSDAAKAFAAVAQQDPSCAMAHWGVAMARRGSLYGGRPGPNALAEGWAAVEQAQTVGGKTPREQDYIAAIAAFYKDAEGIDHRARALAHTRAIEQLHHTYPDDREDATERDPVIPGSIIPARELFGEMLLEADELQQALQAFEASLRVEPNRFWGLYGAARAAELAGDGAKAETYYTQLVTQAGRADSARPALMAAKAFRAK